MVCVVNTDLISWEEWWNFEILADDLYVQVIKERAPQKGAVEQEEWRTSYVVSSSVRLSTSQLG
jgi:hypothetical protein